MNTQDSIVATFDAAIYRDGYGNGMPCGVVEFPLDPVVPAGSILLPDALLEIVEGPQAADGKPVKFSLDIRQVVVDQDRNDRISPFVIPMDQLGDVVCHLAAMEGVAGSFLAKLSLPLTHLATDARVVLTIDGGPVTVGKLAVHLPCLRSPFSPFPPSSNPK
jgi:hypothetical protein